MLPVRHPFLARSHQLKDPHSDYCCSRRDREIPRWEDQCTRSPRSGCSGSGVRVEFVNVSVKLCTRARAGPWNVCLQSCRGFLLESMKVLVV